MSDWCTGHQRLLRIVIRAAKRPQARTASLDLTQTDKDLNSKGDAAVTQALSLAFSVFVPAAMFPDVKPLIRLKPIPLEHSMLAAIFFN